MELTRDEFVRRYRERFYDPAFESHSSAIEALADIGWQAYIEGRKSPRSAPAGPGFSDPAYELADEWRAASQAIKQAQARHDHSLGASRILIINGATRSEHTCPGEMSKTYRLAMIAKEIVEAEPSFEIDFLDLSHVASEYGRTIHPCKTCVSTAMPLCHWPCSCYPNHALGQVNDWMNDIYPMWVAAHGIMIITPTNWYQAPTPLKAMIDRLVCADGGNADPTSTQGKKPALAKKLELDGWNYPKHLAGRMFSVVTHGDAAGVENLRRSLVDWLTDMHLIEATGGTLDAFIGYMRPYATSHADLDADGAVQIEVQNAARALVQSVKLRRAGRLQSPDEGLVEPRPK